jgi:hypothetical protein
MSHTTERGNDPIQMYVLPQIISNFPTLERHALTTFQPTLFLGRCSGTYTITPPWYVHVQRTRFVTMFPTSSSDHGATSCRLLIEAPPPLHRVVHTICVIYPEYSRIFDQHSEVDRETKLIEDTEYPAIA